jgi:hypothetical protein
MSPARDCLPLHSCCSTIMSPQIRTRFYWCERPVTKPWRASCGPSPSAACRLGALQKQKLRADYRTPKFALFHTGFFAYWRTDLDWINARPSSLSHESVPLTPISGSASAIELFAPCYALLSDISQRSRHFLSSVTPRTSLSPPTFRLKTGGNSSPSHPKWSCRTSFVCVFSGQRMITIAKGRNVCSPPFRASGAAAPGWRPPCRSRGPRGRCKTRSATRLACSSRCSCPPPRSRRCGPCRARCPGRRPAQPERFRIRGLGF